jgi:hypothetical protein
MSPPTGKAPMLPSGDTAELTTGGGGGGFFSRLKVRMGLSVAKHIEKLVDEHKKQIWKIRR